MRGKNASEGGAGRFFGDLPRPKLRSPRTYFLEKFGVLENGPKTTVPPIKTATAAVRSPRTRVQTGICSHCCKPFERIGRGRPSTRCPECCKSRPWRARGPVTVPCRGCGQPVEAARRGRVSTKAVSCAACVRKANDARSAQSAGRMRLRNSYRSSTRRHVCRECFTLFPEQHSSRASNLFCTRGCAANSRRRRATIHRIERHLSELRGRVAVRQFEREKRKPRTMSTDQVSTPASAVHERHPGRPLFRGRKSTV